MKGTLFKKLKGKTIQCVACSRYCTIKEGEGGFCGVRKNIDGKLELIVYGKPCALWVDPIEKKPLYHFLPGSKSYSIGTFGCNYSCIFCQNWNISQLPKLDTFWEEKLKLCQELPPEKAVKEAIASGCKSISYTYNEPTIFSEYARDIGIIARKKGLKNVYVTNGYESKECWEYVSEFLDAANIDLKGPEKFYEKLCHATMPPVKASIKRAHDLGIWVEVTTLLIEGENDNEKFLRETAEYIYSIDPEMPWHLTAFFPMYKMKNKPQTSAETLFRARELAKETGLKHVYCGNVISEYENTICPKCKKEIIKRVGFSISEYNLTKGTCNYCGYKLKGVFE